MNIYAADKVRQAAKQPPAGALVCDPVGRLALHLMQVHKAQVHVGPAQGGQVCAMVDAGRVDLPAQHAGFVHVVLRSVEPAEVVDHRHHELQGKIGFQEKALKAFHGKAGGMRLAKRVSRKAFDLLPDVLRELGGVAARAAVVEVLAAQALEGVVFVFFSAHDAAQDVAFVEAEPGEVVHDLHHIFLVHHDSKRLSQMLPEYGVRVGKPMGLVKPADVLAHHARTGYAGPDNGTGGHQMHVIVAAQLVQQPAHGGRLNVETADAVPRAQEGFYARVFLDAGDVVHVGALPLVLVGEVYGVFDMPQAALAEDVELVEADRLGMVHVELRDGKPLGHHLERGVLVEGALGDQHAPGVDRQVVGEAVEQGGIAQNLGGGFGQGAFVAIGACRRSLSISALGRP